MNTSDDFRFGRVGVHDQGRIRAAGMVVRGAAPIARTVCFLVAFFQAGVDAVMLVTKGGASREEKADGQVDLPLH